MSTAAEAPARTKTQYVILQQLEDHWVFASTQEGNTDTDAIKAAIAALGIDEGTFVAVPARSFKPRAVAVQTRRSVTIS